MSKFVLKFLWLEKFIAVSLDQKVGSKTTPITPYFFWPRSDAWEDMKICLENMCCVSETEVVLLLNQVTEVINYWQELDETMRSKEILFLKNRFPDCIFLYC